LREDSVAEQTALTSAVLQASDDPSVDTRLEAWRTANRVAVARSMQVIGEMKAGGPTDLAALSVGVREIRNLIQASAATTSPGAFVGG
jgi:NAD-specific glutamate dehydrogenase